ncbi:hypothetical protein HIM_05361 [Hirsutella minnesotensis 3608]|uniref:Serum paraoxonase/arylesterase family protein n=1 Tax=Hirsutella minnesotensis 3608 TaxID=1043627 RepID=A0A0F8A0A3_9HYPO|nr:hypothetical protein HIM_05361 [Hirsutella minnesotensis 3608]
MATRKSFYLGPGLVLVLALLGSYLYGPSVRRAGLVLGVFRSANQSSHAPEDLQTIPLTAHCEDIHYHKSSNLLFTACEDDPATRHAWFPPLAIFDHPEVGFQARGSLKTIDPKTLKVTTLRFDNFEKPFITHGIDVIDDPDKEGIAVYIFAVNHRPNPDHFGNAKTAAPKSHSVVEVFHHVIGTDAVRHLRTVWHPLITTPNDILALSPISFFVTNDHFYREGTPRAIEDVYYGAKWSDTVYVEFKPDDNSATDDSAGVQASVALSGLHNNNGLGHGKSSQDVLIGSAGSGELHLGTRDKQPTNGSHRISVVESVELDSAVDNPSYFADPFANDTYDGSGFILGGLSRGIELMRNVGNPDAKDSVMVWMVTPLRQDGQAGGGSRGWRKRLIFEDDGSRIRTCSAAVLVAMDPRSQGGQRRARLFVTGFLSKNILAVDIDMD